jgi:hypothetical protein
MVSKHQVLFSLNSTGALQQIVNIKRLICYCHNMELHSIVLYMRPLFIATQRKEDVLERIYQATLS